jgi:hypothetical protein
MLKEGVVIEYIDPIDVSKVAVLLYNDNYVGSVLEVCSEAEANANYTVVGELRNEKVIEYSDDDDYDDYNDDDDYDDYNDDEDIDEDFD